MSVDPTLALKRSWYRTTFYNATILGICNFLAPGAIRLRSDVLGAEPYLRDMGRHELARGWRRGK